MPNIPKNYQHQCLCLSHSQNTEKRVPRAHQSTQSLARLRNYIRGFGNGPSIAREQNLPWGSENSRTNQSTPKYLFSNGSGTWHQSVPRALNVTRGVWKQPTGYQHSYADRGVKKTAGSIRSVLLNAVILVLQIWLMHVAPSAPHVTRGVSKQVIYSTFKTRGPWVSENS